MEQADYIHELKLATYQAVRDWFTINTAQKPPFFNYIKQRRNHLLKEALKVNEDIVSRMDNNRSLTSSLTFKSFDILTSDKLPWFKLLTQKERYLVYLRYHEEYSTSMIAKHCGYEIPSVISIFKVIRKKLLNYFNEEEGLDWMTILPNSSMRSTKQ